MSYLAEVTQEGEAHYKLRQLKGMNCDAHAYLSPKLFAEAEEKLWQQAVNAASYPEVKHLDLNADDFLRPALLLWKQKRDEVEETRRKIKETQERLQLQRLQEKYGQEG